MRVSRIILQQDYDTIKGWFEARQVAPPPVGLLPPTGVFAHLENGVPVACAFLYQDLDAAIGMIEWEATNPAVHSVMAQLRALHCVFDFLEKYAATKGIRHLLSWVAENRGDGRLLEKRGWSRCPGKRHELMAFSTKPEDKTCLS